METPPLRKEQTPPLLLHITKVAQRLGLSQYQTRALVKDGSLPSTIIGNRVYIPDTAVEEYVARIAETA
jgi:excisionase family DNA binding protein